MSNKKGGHQISRKDFLRTGLAAGAIVGFTRAKQETYAAAGKSPDLKPPVPWKEGDDILIRMQNDIHRILGKPANKRRWGMVIDLRKCIGCHACTIACKAENVLPPGVVYRRVLNVRSGTYPDLEQKNVPVLCNHCEKPSCVKACPVNATRKREDGIVAMNYKSCIGCRACLTACPYGARSSDFGHFYTDNTPALQSYETRPSFEYREPIPRKKGRSPIGNARKCHFCTQRIGSGQLPACVTTCIGKATYFGDYNDSDGLLVQIVKTMKPIGLKTEYGLKPQVLYIGLEGVKI